MTRQRLVLLASSILCCQSLPMAAQEPASSAVPAEMPNVRGTLANGLKYEIQATGDGSGNAALAFVVGAGNSQATRAQDQYAHLAEHLLIETSRSPTVPDLKGFALFEYWAGADAPLKHKYLMAMTDEMGARYIPVIDQRRAPGLVAPLELFRSWLAYKPTEEEVNAAARSVLAEIGVKGDMRTARLDSEIQRQLGYDEPDIDAVIAGLKSISREKFDVFFFKFYRPDLTTIYVRGDVDALAVEASIRAIFSPLKNMGAKPPLARRVRPESRLAVATATADFLEKADIVIRIGQAAGAPVTPFDDPRMRERIRYILDRRLGGLYRRYSARMEAASSAVGDRATKGGGSDLLLTVRGCEKDQLRACVEDVVHSFYSLEKFGPTEIDLQFAATEMARYSNEAVPDDRDILARVTADTLDADIQRPKMEAKADALSIKRALSDLLADPRIVVEVRGPASVQKLDNGDIETIFRNARQRAVPLAATADKLPEFRKANLSPPSSFDVRWQKFPLGDVAIVARKEGGALHIVFPAAHSSGRSIRIFAASSGTSGVVSFDSAEISKGVELVKNQGIGGLNRFQLEDYLRERNIEAVQFSTPTESAISMTLRDAADVPIAADIISAYFAVDGVSHDALPDFMRQAASIDTGQGLGAAETIDADRLLAAYRSAFRSPMDFVYIVNGALDPNARDAVVRDLAKGLLFAPPTRDVFIQAKDAFSGGRRDPLPQASQLHISVRWAVPRAGPPSFDGVVDNRIANVLGLRMFSRLRGREADVYTPMAYFGSRMMPQMDYGGVVLNTSHDAATRIVDATIEELQSFRQGALSEDEWASLTVPLSEDDLANIPDIQLYRAYVGARGDMRVLRNLAHTAADRSSILRRISAIPPAQLIDVVVTAK